MKLSNSGYSCFLSCPKKYEYEHVKRRVPAKENPAFALGTAVHSGLEAFWNGLGLDRALADTDRECSDQIMAIKARAMVSGYYSLYCQGEWETVSVEDEVHYEHAGVTQVMKADAVARRKSDNTLFLIDHKTVGDRSCNGDLADQSSSFWMSLRINTQATGYQVVLEEKYGEPVHVLWDAILKVPDRGPKYKPRKPTKRKSETDIEFAARCLEAMESDDEFNERVLGEYLENPDKYYTRKEIARTSRDREEWGKEFSYVAGQIIQSKETGIFPRNQSQCISKYGKCPYYDVCHQLDTLDSSNYTDKPERYGKKLETRKVDF